VFGKTADILNNGIFGEDGISGSEQDFHLYQAYVQHSGRCALRSATHHDRLRGGAGAAT
jgi:hypothetical protein